MTLLELVHQRNAENKALKVKIHQLTVSRDAWKTKHRGCRWENQELRRAVKRLRLQRDRWKSGQRPRSRPAEWKNIHLTDADLERIMEIKPR